MSKIAVIEEDGCVVRLLDDTPELRELIAGAKSEIGNSGEDFPNCAKLEEALDAVDPEVSCHGDVFECGAVVTYTREW